MDFICSLTGKSPSTTGFGSEGALTKGPFNALPPVIDINNALVSLHPRRLRGLHHRGRIHRSEIPHRSRQQHARAGALVPHARLRARPAVSHPATAISKRSTISNFEGRSILASRLGYRITPVFRRSLSGPYLRNAGRVFTEEMLRPEKQDLADFVAGVDAIVEAQRKVALKYFEDGSVEAACPPIKALLHIMVEKTFDESIRSMFTRDYLLASDWYQDRLKAQQQRDVAYAVRFQASPDRLKYLESEAHLNSLKGTIGADPSLSKAAQSIPA